ncbi:MAG TPA: hypothetical protein VMN57_15715, partial [Anaerolineales bacterium]|nr:hypothetical protein [Anaerolineales bacterium]
WTDSATGFFQSGGFTQKNVQAIDFSPGGAHLAAVSDNEVWIRNIATGVVTARLGGHTDRVLTLAFTAAGGGSYLLATGSRDDTAQIWRLSTSMEAEHLVTLEHGSWVSAVAFSPEGELLATGGYDSSIYLWDTNGFALGPPLHRSSQDQILALDFSPVGGLLAAGSVNGLRVWQPERSDFELPLTSRYFRFLGPGPFNPAPQYLDNWFHDRPEIELQTFGTLPPTLEAAGNGFRTLQPVPESMTLQSAGVFNSETGDTVGLIQIYVFTSFFGPARLTFLQTSWDLRMVDWPVSPAAMLVEAQVEGLPGEIVIGGWGFEEALQDGMTIRDWAHDASSLSIRWQDDDWYYSVFLDMPFDMGLIIDSELRIDLNGLIDLIETGWKQ